MSSVPHKPESFFSRRAIPVGDRDLEFNRATLLKIFLFGFLLMTLLSVLAVRRMTSLRPLPAEVAAAPLQIGSGVIVGTTGTTYSPGRGSIFKVARLGVELRIQDHVVWALAPDKDEWRAVKPGDTVIVTYRTDRRGNIYVQDWHPAQ